MTAKQKAILNFLKDGQKKKSEIVEKFSYWYYRNTQKYIGEVLKRMLD